MERKCICKFLPIRYYWNQTHHEKSELFLFSSYFSFAPWRNMSLFHNSISATQMCVVSFWILDLRSLIMWGSAGSYSYNMIYFTIKIFMYSVLHVSGSVLGDITGQSKGVTLCWKPLGTSIYANLGNAKEKPYETRGENSEKRTAPLHLKLYHFLFWCLTSMQRNKVHKSSWVKLNQSWLIIHGKYFYLNE